MERIKRWRWAFFSIDLMETRVTTGYYTKEEIKNTDCVGKDYVKLPWTVRRYTK